jgi:hypothetical protein
MNAAEIERFLDCTEVDAESLATDSEDQHVGDAAARARTLAKRARWLDGCGRASWRGPR